MSSQHRARTPISFVLLLVALFLLAACGDSTAARPTSATAQAAPTEQADNSTKAEPTHEQDAQIPGDIPSQLATATILASQMPTQDPGIDLKTLDPCSFLTREEAESILGPLDWKPTKKFNEIDEENGCSFDTNYEGSLNKTLTIGLARASDWEYQTMQATPDGYSSIANIGDAGLTWDATVWRTTIILLRSKAIIILRTEPKDLDQAAQLARLIVAHIQ